MRGRVLIILLLVGLSLSSQTVRVIDFSGFIEHVTNNSPAAQRIYNTARAGEYQVEQARGQYDPQVSGSTNNKYFSDKQYYSYVKADIKQPIFTNQYIKAGYEYGKGAYINPEYSTPTVGLPYLGFEVGLLQGLIIDKRRAEVLKAQAYRDALKARSKADLNAVLFHASTDYAEWLFSRKQNQLFTFFFQLADFRTASIRHLTESGERAAIDTVEAEIYLQSRQLERQGALLDFTRKLADIRTYNWNSPNDPADTTAQLQPMDSLESLFLMAKKNTMALMGADVNLHPMLAEYRAKQRVYETEVRFRKEMIKPQLDVGYNFLYNEKTNSYLSANNYKWQATLSFPLFLRTSRNAYKLAKLDVENNGYDYLMKQAELLYKHTYLNQSTKLLLDQIALATQAADYSKRLLEAERLKFGNGESSVFMINSRESKWLETELKLCELKLKFVINYFQYIYLSGDNRYVR